MTPAPLSHPPSERRARRGRTAGPVPRPALIIVLLALVLGTACGRKAVVKPPASPQPTPAPTQPPAAAPTPPPVGITVAPTPPPTAPQPAAPPAGLPTAGPGIRIGLELAAGEVRISAPGDFYLQEKAAEAARQLVQGPVQLRLESGSSTRTGVFRVQVASLSRRDSAEDLRGKLARDFSLPVTVNESQSGYYQIWAGEFSSKEEAQDFAAGRARNAGYPDAFVVTDKSSAASGTTTIALRGPQNLFRINAAGFLIFPAAASEFLRLDGKPYRGILDISIARNGRLQVVNQLGVEEYLLGVVAAEMSPSTYPHAQALAAQATAARTYALKNMGRYRADGFDLTNDTRTQVYGGAAAEREASNEAVRGTAGLAIYYKGQLIDAMYASTCGGRTEDFAAVFGGPPVPYLTGVLCAVESAAAEPVGPVVTGSHALDRLVYAGDGRIANRELELALLFGLLQADSITADYLEEPLEAPEAKTWVEAARRLGRNSRQPPPTGERTMTLQAGFLQYVAEALLGAAEIDRSISRLDSAYYMANLRDGAAVPEPARPALAYLMQKGLWQGFPDHSARPADPVLRKDALCIIMRLIHHTRPDLLSSGTLVELKPPSTAGAGAALTLRRGSRSQTLRLADDVRLFQRSGERCAPAENLTLIGSERLSFRLDAHGRIDFLEVELNPTGASSDRFSPAAAWQVTLAREQVSEKLQPLAPGLGEVLDLEAERLGSSGRVVQFKVTGTRRSAVLNGYRIRGALGLKDTLITIRRSFGPEGKIESFIFDGRGYGHGVGLCQVGAYGMALAGRTSEEILKTYYTGVDIAKAY